MRIRGYPGLRQPETGASRGEAGGQLHSKTVRTTEAMKKKRRKKEERQTLIPSQ